VDSIELPANSVELLNFMPNLKEIKFWSITKFNSGTIAGGELKLLKLKKIESYKCSPETLQIFNKLPPGVLQELHIT
jgi:hypothetical protein